MSTSPALASGAIDATEWIGPAADLGAGLYQAAKYYYTFVAYFLQTGKRGHKRGSGIPTS